MVSSVFVLLMVFSRSAAGGNEDNGVKILYGTMSAAYLTAELWLGALNSLIALLLPPRYKTFGLSIWAATQVLVYSAGPEIIGLALKDEDSSSQTYLDKTRVALAVIIPVGYWVAGLSRQIRFSQRLTVFASGRLHFVGPRRAWCHLRMIWTVLESARLPL
jgi:hypothetical protein